MTPERIGRLESLHQWSWNTHKDAWNVKYEQFQAFVKTNKRFPLYEGAEKPLALWVRRQKTDNKKDKLDPTQVAKLERIGGWQWVTPLDEEWWLQSFQKLEQFVQREERFPIITSTNQEEHVLAQWMFSQKSKKDKLNDNRLAKLESLSNWKWSEQEQYWKDRLSQVSAFVDVHKRYPMRDDNAELVTWINNQKQRYHKGNLPAEQQCQLEQIQGWVWHGYSVLSLRPTTQWDGRYDELVEFVKRQKKLPTRATDASIYKWMTHQKLAYKAKRLSVDQINKLEVISGWKWVG